MKTLLSGSGQRLAGLLIAVTLILLGAGPFASRVLADDEFVGPFPSWRNLQSDFGAVGDGRADDTEPLQRALDALTRHTNFCVLYVPAGTYRLTRTVGTVRKAHTDMQGVAVIGEDPARTVLRWDGPDGGTLLRWDAWYSKLARLTLDGAGRAGVALYVGDAFSTYNESSDLVLRDARLGMQFGDAPHAGQAEHAVLRCQFLRCSDAGIKTVNFNSMDIWVWHSRFEACGHALFNVMGNFHAWHNLFLRSRVADLGTQNLMVFSFVGNTSVGSTRFLDFESGHTWGSPTTLAANRILDPTGDLPLKLGNAGPYLVMDNVFRLPAGTTNRAAWMTWADQTFVGNTYTVTHAVVERGRFRRVAERVVPRAQIPDTLPELPGPPPRRERQVFEVAPGADAATCQRALDAAAALAGQRPVVHLPMGTYRMATTLVVPAGADLQLVGDSAGETGTRLEWTGPAGGTLLRLAGPTRATVRDLYLHAPNARALCVERADQPGGRIFADQLNVSGPNQAAPGTAAALRVQGLDRTDVQLRCLQGSGNAGTWVETIGGPLAASGQATNQISVFTGATGSAAGQYSVRRHGRLTVRSVYHEKSADALRGLWLNDAGMLAIDATRFSYQTSPTAPLVAVDGFRGLLTIATGLLLPVDSTATCRFEITGDGRAASVLSLNNQFWLNETGVTADTVWQNRAAPPARGGLLGCNVNSGLKGATKNGFDFLQNLGENADMAKSRDGSGPLADRGSVDDATLLRHLAPLREARVWEPASGPAGVTDLRLHRVMVSAGGGGAASAVEFRRD